MEGQVPACLGEVLGAGRCTATVLGALGGGVHGVAGAEGVAGGGEEGGDHHVGGVCVPGCGVDAVGVGGAERGGGGRVRVGGRG